MPDKVYRVHFFFEISDIVRHAALLTERILEDRPPQQRVQVMDIVFAWLEYYLEREMYLVIARTDHTWAQQFIDSDLLNNQMLNQMCYHTFSHALHPALHPCFHQQCTLVVSPHDLRLEYVVPTKDSP